MHAARKTFRPTQIQIDPESVVSEITPSHGTFRKKAETIDLQHHWHICDTTRIGRRPACLLHKTIESTRGTGGTGPSRRRIHIHGLLQGQISDEQGSARDAGGGGVRLHLVLSWLCASRICLLWLAVLGGVPLRQYLRSVWRGRLHGLLRVGGVLWRQCKLCL